MSYKEKRKNLSLSKISSSDSPYITGNQNEKTNSKKSKDKNENEKTNSKKSGDKKTNSKKSGDKKTNSKKSGDKKTNSDNKTNSSISMPTTISRKSPSCKTSPVSASATAYTPSR